MLLEISFDFIKPADYGALDVSFNVKEPGGCLSLRADGRGCSILSLKSFVFSLLASAPRFEFCDHMCGSGPPVRQF